MKRILSIMICVFALFAFTACGGGGASGGGGEGSGNSEPAKADVSYEEIDLDLTAMSDTVMYSVVTDMANNPEEYMGRTIKMTGAFASMYVEEQGKTLYACLIQDATACCSQGLEFEPTEKPDESLEQGSEITVVGVLDSYVEDDVTYCTLRNAVLL